MASTSSSKRHVALDLDWTLVNWSRPFWHIAGEIVGLDGTNVVPREYGLHPYPDAIANMLRHLFSSEWFMCEAVWPTHGAGALVDWLVQRFDLVSVISSRVESIREPTKRMVERFFGIDSVYFVDPGNSKWPLFNMHGVDVWIDDNPNDLVDARVLGLEVYAVAAPWTDMTRLKVVGCGEKYDSCADVLFNLDLQEREHGKKKQGQGSAIRAVRCVGVCGKVQPEDT